MPTVLSRCREGEEDAWRELIQEHGTTLFRFCLGALTRNEDMAYDLAQETWFKAVRAIDSFREEAAVKTWLFRIAVNSWRNRLRTKERKPEAVLLPDPVTGDLPEAVHDLSPDRCFGANHDLAYVLGQLGEDCQMVINLRFVMGYGEREIADILEQNEKAVSARISRCRARAREIYYAG